jgi:hypothetical protein
VLFVYLNYMLQEAVKDIFKRFCDANQTRRISCYL